MRAFEILLLCHVAHTVEAGEVSAGLLSELFTEMERARELPQEEGHAPAVQDIAERLGLPVDETETMLAALEAPPTGTRELVLRRIVDARLVGQRGAYGACGPAGGSDADS
jgi:hypothetical protein